MDFYDDQWQRGEKDTYYGNAKSLRRNDKMRSMRVSPACCVTLFVDKNYQGRSTKECAENDQSLIYSTLHSSWDKKVSSIKLELSKYLFRSALSNNLKLEMLTLGNFHVFICKRERTVMINLSEFKKIFRQDFTRHTNVSIRLWMLKLTFQSLND